MKKRGAAVFCSIALIMSAIGQTDVWSVAASAEEASQAAAETTEEIIAAEEAAMDAYMDASGTEQQMMMPASEDESGTVEAQAEETGEWILDAGDIPASGTTVPSAGGTGQSGGTGQTPPEQSGTEPPEPEQPGTEPPEPETETGPAEKPPADDTDSGAKQVHLGIDNRRLYEGMNQPFSEGYEPEIRDGKVYLTVPFTANGPLAQDRITIDLEFEEKENSPFVFRSYQKDVQKKQYAEIDGKMCETTADESAWETYLYAGEILLQKNAAPGQYAVTVRAWGYTTSGVKTMMDCRIFVQIPEPPKTESGKKQSLQGSRISGGGGGGQAAEQEELIRQPKMLLEDCGLLEKQLEAGKTEKFQASFRNCSSSQAMYNLKVTVTPASDNVRLQKNSFYFSYVAPQECIELSENISVPAEAEEGPVQLEFSFEYEDKKGTAATGKETMQLVVAQPVRMELQMAQIPAVLYASDTMELDIQALNLSRGSVYNVRAVLEGEGMFPNGEAFIGNLEAGTQGAGTLRAYVGTRSMEKIGDERGSTDAEKYGPVSGTVTLKYEDAAGGTHELVQEYGTEIKKAELLSLKVEEEPEANSWWISVFAVIIAGLILMVALLMLRLHRSHVLLEEARM